jgi:hypothetical protein
VFLTVSSMFNSVLRALPSRVSEYLTASYFTGWSEIDTYALSCKVIVMLAFKGHLLNNYDKHKLRRYS